MEKTSNPYLLNRIVVIIQSILLLPLVMSAPVEIAREGFAVIFTGFAMLFSYVTDLGLIVIIVKNMSIKYPSNIKPDMYNLFLSAMLCLYSNIISPKWLGLF